MTSREPRHESVSRSSVVKSLAFDDYASEFLFGPLGIADFHWKKTPKGLPDTEGGLYLEAEQLAKIGYLQLRDGVWDGRRILPEGWVAQATARRVDNVDGAGRGYGYQWWRIDRAGTTIWAGLGFGGQFLVILPEHDVVGVINSWNLFGPTRGSILNGFVDALIASEQTAARRTGGIRWHNPF